jgi:tetratricopeptide (TPR) repeat protein
MGIIAIEHYKTAIQLLRTYKEDIGDENYLQKIAHLHSLIGDSHDAMNDDRNAIEYYEEALKCNVLSFSMADELHTKLSNLFQKDIEKYDAVIEHLKQSLNIKMNQENENILDIASLNNEIGWYYYLINDCDSAILHCQKAMTLYENHTDTLTENMDYANVLNSLGVIYYKLNDHNKAWNYCWRSMSILKQNITSIDDYDVTYAFNYEILGNIFLSKSKKPLACSCLKKALTLFEKQESNIYSNNIKTIEQLLAEQFNTDDVYEDIDNEFEWMNENISSIEGLSSPQTRKRRKFE